VAVNPPPPLPPDDPPLLATPGPVGAKPDDLQLPAGLQDLRKIPGEPAILEPPPPGLPIQPLPPE
jgi:hypothetical protein